MIAPDNIKKIIESLRTQDNRSTDQPVFCVQEREFLITEQGHHDTIQWFKWSHGECNRVSDRLEKALDKREISSKAIPEGYQKFHLKENWRHVQSFFTEAGAKEFITADGHNHGELRIYAGGSFRNFEFRAIRDFLLGLEHGND